MTLSKKKIAGISGLILILMIAGFVVTKKISPIGANWWGEINNSSGVALAGYDVVAYQTMSKAVSGDSQYKTSWHNIEWHFSSEANKNLFLASPEQYAPQYGGYCSFAVSKGVMANTDPLVWHVENNKLYLFMDEGVKSDWISGNGIVDSERNWQ